MAAFFISDAHLGLGPRSVEKEKENRLLAFFDHIFPSAEELFILGDLFDFWFDYATVIPRGFHRTLAALQRFTDAGKPIHYLVGNHDCWMGDFFETEIGVVLHRAPFEQVVQGKRLLLHHGDGLAGNDRGYQLVKPVLRNPLAIRAYRWLHPDIGVRLARGTSRSSREYTTQKHYGEEEGMIRYAREAIDRGCNIVVMGHRHLPTRITVGNGIYINLGDWITHNSYAEMTGGMIDLKSWHRPS
jgi:UDP-2,3-diacylglucosamine hydrolase